ncbi:MAG TPA: MFS transporter [Rhizomicrobium sp.]
MNAAVHVACDAAAARSRAPGRRAARYPNLVLATSILASSLAFIDGSVVNVGLHAFQAAFHADAGALQWIVNIYLLPLSALLLLGGAMGDAFGNRRVLAIAVAGFGLASALCMVANSLPLLLLGRALQGIAAAFVLPNSLAVLSLAFSGEKRGRAIGIWAAVGAGIGAVGPVLGGYLIDMFGWRAIFVINLPVSLAAVVLAILFVSDPPREDRRASLDITGGALATASLALFTYALTAATGHAGWNMTSIATLAAGLVLFAIFIRTEIAKGDGAMVPLSLFAKRDFIGLTILTFLVYGALGGVFVLVPYVLIGVAHYSGTQAGAALLPLPVVLAALSPLMGSLAGRIGSRAMLTAGPVLVGCGFALLFRVTGEDSYWTTVFPALATIALGMSGVAAPLTTAVLASAGPRDSGSASGFNSAVSRLGGLIATALLGGVLAATGADLIHEFHLAAGVCAGACVLAAVSLLALK